MAARILKTALSLTLFLLFLQTTVFSQHWYRHRHELFGAAGVSAMLGDLGGGEEQGREGLGDLNLEAINFAFSAGYRYKLSEQFTFRSSLSFIRASASDEYTDNPGRRDRNLSVRTDIIEISPMIEFFLLNERIPRNSRFGSRYFRNRIRGGGIGVGMYVATGITAFYYRPMAQYQGTWHDLRSLGTEGQGVKPGLSPYDEIDLAIPFTFGFKFNTSLEWAVGIEASARWTFTDYLDDVSSNYYDNNAIAQANGSVAAALADRRFSDLRGTTSDIRGNDANNDVYLFVQVVLSKRLKSTRGRRAYF